MPLSAKSKTSLEINLFNHERHETTRKKIMEKQRMKAVSDTAMIFFSCHFVPFVVKQ